MRSPNSLAAMGPAMSSPTRLRRGPSPSHKQQTATTDTYFSSSSSAVDGKGTGCPFSDVGNSINPKNPAPSGCPFHAHKGFDPASDVSVKERVPLATFLRVHHPSSDQANLLRDIGGGDRIREICTRFYARMHADEWLQQFLFMDDGPVHHGRRLADWIIEKMGGEGTPWTDSGRSGMRQPAHAAAWNSARRDSSVRGRRFKLDDCRVWMRLHFWAVREVGLDKHAAFFDWYKQFLGHFIAVYERSAPRYVEDSAAWSANPDNIQAYLKDNTMHDVIGFLG